METRLQVLEGKDLEKSAGSTKGKPKIEMYEKDRKKGAGALTTPAKVSTKNFFRTVNYSSQ
jgi:nucleolar protein 58